MGSRVTAVNLELKIVIVVTFASNNRPVIGESQIPILHKYLKSFILKSQNGPNLNPKSKPQIPISKLKIPMKSQIPIFPQVHKHELRSVQQRRELSIRQCHCHCYLIACLKCLCVCHISYSLQLSQRPLRYSLPNAISKVPESCGLDN